ncbi:MAG: flagellar hook protein FlgE [Succinivibrionaceae bacterium]|nr:flagellar hook protein FlgE [Succinivibrionaceae bacterium]
MSLNISVSGINAAQKHLDVTANNIANVNTIGFKGSRAEFADVYSSSVYTDNRTNVGNGVQTAAVTQQFTQGSVNTTSNTLDLAIKGDGFFVLAPENGSLDRTYTRAGAFQCNKNGYVTNSQGSYLQVYDVNNDGTVKSISLDSTHALKIPDTAGSPEETTKVNASMTLPASAKYQDPESFDPNNPDTYAASTSVKVYDSLGESHTATYYFVKDSNFETAAETTTSGANTWQMFVFIDDKPVDIADRTDADKATEITFNDTTALKATKPKLKCATLVFDSDGNIKKDPTTNVTTGMKPAIIKTIELGNGTDQAKVIPSGANQKQVIEFAFSELHMYGGTTFSVDNISQDGSTVGQLTNVEINDKGLVSATYSNGTSTTLGMVAMANFSNTRGLTQIGDTCWRQSLDSGLAIPAQAGQGTAGSIQSSALEASNTDLAAQLVELISAQRNYQANSKALDINNTVMDSILNIR